MVRELESVLRRLGRARVEPLLAVSERITKGWLFEGLDRPALKPLPAQHLISAAAGKFTSPPAFVSHPPHWKRGSTEGDLEILCNSEILADDGRS